VNTSVTVKCKSSSSTCKPLQKCGTTKAPLDQKQQLWFILLPDSRADPQLTRASVESFVCPELEQIRREAERLTNEMSQADWHQAPPGRWSCAQIFEHLILSYAATTKGTLKAMGMGKPLGGKPTLRDRVTAFYVVGLGILPSGRTAPEQTIPRNGAGIKSLGPFNDALVAMDATLTDAEKRFGSRVKLLDHVVLGPLTANEWRLFHRIHAKHHLKQVAERIRQNGSTIA
jgi:Protein of unknown function (DUF1569)